MSVPSRPRDFLPSPTVSVVIPVPPAGRLPLLFAGLARVHEVIVVVEPEQDTALAVPRTARVIRQTRPGVGNAVACGVAAATGDVIVTLPGDGSCDPADVPRLVEALRAGADVAEGVRRPAGRRRPPIGDLVLLWFMRVLFGIRPTDPGSGFRAFRREGAERLGLPRVAGTEAARGDGRDGEILITVRSRRAGLRVTGVPVATLPRPGGGAVLTGLHALTREHLARRRKTREAAAPDSIVVLTGGTGSRPATGSRPVTDSRPANYSRPATDSLPATGAGDGSGVIDPFRLAQPGHDGPGVNVARTPLPDRHPADHGTRRWAVPNRAVAAHPTGAGRLDHPNSAGLGSPDRRHGERRSTERRHPGPDRSGEAMNRRRWRDDHGDAGPGRPRAQGRPDLRVINGEGGGSGGGRGHLRPVPRRDQP